MITITFRKTLRKLVKFRPRQNKSLKIYPVEHDY